MQFTECAIQSGMLFFRQNRDTYGKSNVIIVALIYLCEVITQRHIKSFS